MDLCSGGIVPSNGAGRSQDALTGIDHVQLAIPVGGEARARKFYGEADADFRPARKAHAALVVDGLDTLVATLEIEGYPVRRDEPLDGRRRVYVDDPFSSRIELIEA